MIGLPLPVKMPQIVKWLYPSYVWDKKKDCKDGKYLFLTFDDGPIPDVTPWVLSLLKRYDARATFFMIGENINKHPEIFQDVLRDEHRIGNHTYNHLNGKKTGNLAYWQNISKAEQIIEESFKKTASKYYLEHQEKAKLFRPPYGLLKRSQSKIIREKGYSIVLYETLAYDWDKKINGLKCSKNVLNNAENGSIVLFHDSLKAFKNLQVALPIVLDYFSKEGYSFKTL